MSKAIAPIDEIRSNLTRMSDQFKAALPAHVTPEKFIRVAMTAIQSNPKLLECDRRSLYGELVKCASDGLMPNGSESAIIPYGGAAKYQPMVKGICKLARNSGEISTMDALVVYENDQYEAWIDEKGQHFKHIKAKTNRGAPILTYAYALTKDGGFYFEEMDEEQMRAIEACSRGKDSPWKGSFKDEMKRKSALKRLAKFRLPSSTDLDEVISRDDDMYDLNAAPPPATVATPSPQADSPPKKTKPSKLSKIIDEQVIEHEATPPPVAQDELPL